MTCRGSSTASALPGRGQCRAVRGRGTLWLGPSGISMAPLPLAQIKGSSTVKACIQTLPSFRVIFDSFPLQMFLFPLAVGALPPPMASSELSCQSFTSQMHLHSYRVKNSSYSFWTKWNSALLGTELLKICQAVSACKGKGTIFANRFHIIYSVFTVIWLKFIHMVF